MYVCIYKYIRIICTLGVNGKAVNSLSQDSGCKFFFVPGYSGISRDVLGPNFTDKKAFLELVFTVEHLPLLVHIFNDLLNLP